jgi:hypothetical protein
MRRRRSVFAVLPINFTLITHYSSSSSSSSSSPCCALHPAPCPLYLSSAHNISNSSRFCSTRLFHVSLYTCTQYTSSCSNIRSIIYARRLKLAHAHFRDSDPLTRIPSPLTRVLTSVHFPKLPARLNSYSSLSTLNIITDALSDLVPQLSACRVSWRLPSALLNRVQPYSSACCGRPTLWS